MPQLTDLHRAILDFEREHPVWKWQAAKNAAVRERFGLSPWEYAQKVAWIIRQPEALAYAPTTVRRLQRLGEWRRQVRSASRLST